jgi:hypothetical protein
MIEATREVEQCLVAQATDLLDDRRHRAGNPLVRGQGHPDEFRKPRLEVRRAAVEPW